MQQNSFIDRWTKVPSSSLTGIWCHYRSDLIEKTESTFDKYLTIPFVSILGCLGTIPFDFACAVLEDGSLNAAVVQVVALVSIPINIILYWLSGKKEMLFRVRGPHDDAQCLVSERLVSQFLADAGWLKYKEHLEFLKQKLGPNQLMRIFSMFVSFLAEKKVENQNLIVYKRYILEICVELLNKKDEGTRNPSENLNIFLFRSLVRLGCSVEELNDWMKDECQKNVELFKARADGSCPQFAEAVLAGFLAEAIKKPKNNQSEKEIINLLLNNAEFSGKALERILIISLLIIINDIKERGPLPIDDKLIHEFCAKIRSKSGSILTTVINKISILKCLLSIFNYKENWITLLVQQELFSKAYSPEIVEKLISHADCFIKDLDKSNFKLFAQKLVLDYEDAVTFFKESVDISPQNLKMLYKACREFNRKFHPDKNPSNKAECETRIIKMQEYRKFLSNCFEGVSQSEQIILGALTHENPLHNT